MKRSTSKHVTFPCIHGEHLHVVWKRVVFQDDNDEGEGYTN